MNCESRREKRHYYLSSNLVELHECREGQKDPDGKVHSCLGHSSGPLSTEEPCHPKANAKEGTVLSEFLGRKLPNSSYRTKYLGGPEEINQVFT